MAPDCWTVIVWPSTAKVAVSPDAGPAAGSVGTVMSGVSIPQPGRSRTSARARRGCTARHYLRARPPASVIGVAAESAISLRGAVKRFGAITAVAGLDLDVP